MKYYIVYFNKFDDIITIAEFDNRDSFDSWIQRINDNSPSMYVYGATYIKTYKEIS
jgi:hypothetical protein